MDLFSMLDSVVSTELGVDLESYIDVIENRCTLEEAQFIINGVLTEENDIEAAKALFNSKLN